MESRATTAEVASLANELRPLTDVLCGCLREEILNGSLPPGTELRQEVLARRFGVSRVPIREAMSRLQAEGLIVLRPRRGFAVISLDIAEIIEIFELRMVLEQHALETAARLRSESDVREVEAILLEMEALDPAAADHLPDWLKLNREFHARLVASAKRNRLSSITTNLRDTIEPYIRIESYATGEVETAAHEHRDIFDAFKSRDATRAGQIIRDHCLGSMTRLVDSIRERRVGTVFGQPSKKNRR